MEGKREGKTHKSPNSFISVFTSLNFFAARKGRHVWIGRKSERNGVETLLRFSFLFPLFSAGVRAHKIAENCHLVY